MASGVKTTGNWPFAAPRRLWRIGAAVFACAVAAPVLAHAHSGMSGQEVGPPIVTSGLLGFVSYWLVMLWPSSRKKNDSDLEGGKQSGHAPPIERRSPKHSARVKRAPRLRKIEGNGRVLDNQAARRKASDG